ncbi:conserved hypothetical protein [Mucor ambiguus]|uniref:IPT/TIG domain-containing protein n=1 Tax=Mucor ambiguus TaxID=91626 RepID=A0A0C9N5R4_9FUNG|nr:conserved hypothetical protein [Mucor ambiguus]
MTTDTKTITQCSSTRKLSQADLEDLLDPQVGFLPLFQDLNPGFESLYSPYSPNQDSSSTTDTSSPPDSHYEDMAMNTENTAVVPTSTTTPDDFLNYLSYPYSEIVTHNGDTTSPCTQSSNNRLQIRILGVPNTGAKSRVETQIKLCIQLMTGNEKKVQDWSYIRLSDSMLARSRLRKNQQQQQKSMDGSVATMVSDESKVLRLEAQVVCASSTDQPIRMCVGCVRRERKRAERTKDGKHKGDILPEDIEAERDRILLFNCSPMINFSSGDAILPTRITCYCRHHNEKVGFRICFSMKNNKDEIIANGISPPIMITDDHKSSKQKTNRKRSRQEDDQLTISRPNTPAPSRKNSISIDPIQPTTDILDDNIESTTPTSLEFINSGISVMTNSNSSSSSNIYSDLFPLPPAPLSLNVPMDIPTPQQQYSSEEDTVASTEEAWPFNRRRRTTSGYASTDDHVMTSILDDFRPVAAVPQLERLVPAQGPTYGGVEVTLLGSGFYRGLTCLFGEHVATTVYWNPNTIVCILPPAANTGPVVVSFKEHPLVLEGQDVAIFTYYDASDQALLELALQVVGLKMTGKLHDAKHVAMRIVQGGEPSQPPQPQQQQQHQHQQRQLSVLEAIQHADQPDLSFVNANGQTLLHLSVILGNEELVRAIIHAYAHRPTKDKQELLNTQDRNEMTALQFACQMRSMEMIRILLNAGANPTSVDSAWLKRSCAAAKDIIDLLDLYTSTHIKRKPLSRRNSNVKSHMMHRFHSLSNTSTETLQHGNNSSSSSTDSKHTPSMESDGLGLVRQKNDRRLYLFWLPVLMLAVGLLFVQMFGQPALLRPILNLLPNPHRIPLSA